MTSMRMGSNIPVPGQAVRVTLRWTSGPGVPDIDASALLLGPSGVVGGDADFVFYNQPTHPSGSVAMVGKTAGSDPVDVDLARVPAATDRIVLAASAADGTFGQVPGLQLVLTDRAAGTELAVFAMDADAETAFVCAELYRRKDSWKFRAVGQGYASGLAGLAADFGIRTGESPAPTPPPAPPVPAAPAPAAPAAPPPPPPPSLDLGAPAPAAAPPAAAPPAAPSLDLSPPTASAPSVPPAPARPTVSSATALDLDAPWPPR